MQLRCGQKQRLWKWAMLCCASAGWIEPTAATVIYDSNGFDNVTRFSSTFLNPNEPTLGNLRGQDAAVNQWLYNGPNTAVSTTGKAHVIVSPVGPVQSGTQAVQVDRVSADNRWAPNVTFTPTGASNSIVQVTWDLNVTLSGSPNFGPFMGIEAYGNGVTGSKRLGGAGVDASTGEFLYEDPTLGFNVVNFNSGTGFGFKPGAGYHHYELDFNYLTQKYSALVDGITQASNISFINTGKTQFTDADISALQAAPTGSDNAAATAYFDNYVISSIPEPASGLLIVSIGVAGLLTRRPNGKRS